MKPLYVLWILILTLRLSSQDLASYFTVENSNTLYSTALDKECDCCAKNEANELKISELEALIKKLKQELNKSLVELEKISTTSKDESEILNLPVTLMDRQVAERQEPVTVSERLVRIKIYDHEKIDRDVVSLYFNGEWILERFTISDRPHELILKLDPAKSNYLILQAENLGVIPPNTLAIRVIDGGQTKEIILHSDVYESEMIRFEYAPKR